MVTAATGFERERQWLAKAIDALRATGWEVGEVANEDDALQGHKDEGDGVSMTGEAVALAAEATQLAVVRMWHRTLGMADLIVVWQGTATTDDEAAEVITDWLSGTMRASDAIERVLEAVRT